ncbi:MAG: hypothetical protein Q8904_14400 [Bacteroidota bacterium]|nr:hypothetical protein [Bacteroidota bacterium]
MISIPDYLFNFGDEILLDLGKFESLVRESLNTKNLEDVWLRGNKIHTTEFIQKGASCQLMR